MIYLQIVIISLFSGLNSSSWGAFKDTPYEKFSKFSFFRSILIAPIMAAISIAILHILNAPEISFVVFFFIVLAAERCFTEIYKMFFRDERQEKYNIPSKLHFFGEIVNSNIIRYSFGLASYIVIMFFFFLFKEYNLSFGIEIIDEAFFGFLFGLLIPASSGAYKDAPIEGFELKKFFRSPIFTMLSAIILGFFTNSYLLIGAGMFGGERLFSEFYKTFIVKKIPGKFRKDLVKFKEWEHKRNIFKITYIVSLFGIILGLLFGSFNLIDIHFIK